jgi:hypothetical protein
MKAKILMVGLIALLMAGGLVLISCENPCQLEAGDCTLIGKAIVCANSSCIIQRAIMAEVNEIPLSEAEYYKVLNGCDCK